MKNVKIEKGTKCFDCKNELTDNAIIHVYEADKKYYKCNECFKKKPKLENFRKTEVYSRVVGYMRPIDNWNKGKQEEYKDRKEFKIK